MGCLYHAKEYRLAAQADARIETLRQPRNRDAAKGAVVGSTAIGGAVLSSGATALAGKSTGKAAFKLSRAGQINWDMRKLEKFRERGLGKERGSFCFRLPLRWDR